MFLVVAPIFAQELHLVPHRGSSPADERVRNAQAAVHEGGGVAALHALGWAFVAVARRTQDPGNYGLADSAARAALAEDHDDLEALLLRGHALHSLHRFEEAEAVARRLVASRGSWADHALLGDTVVDRGGVDEAITPYQRMMELRPSPVAYGRAAHLRWLRGDLAGAIESLARAARSTGPDAEVDAWHRVRLGELILSLGRVDAARQLAASAMAAVPEFPLARLLVGHCDLIDGRPDAACETLGAAARACPEPRFLWPLIEAQRAAQRWDDARDTERRLLAGGAEDDPRIVSLYLATHGQESLRALRLAVTEARARRDVHTLDAIAWALLRAGFESEALPIQRLALAHGTPDPRLLLHAAIAEEVIGDRQRAATLRERLLPLERSLYPSEKGLIAALDVRLGRAFTTPLPRTGDLSGPVEPAPEANLAPPRDGLPIRDAQR